MSCRNVARWLTSIAALAVVAVVLVTSARSAGAARQTPLPPELQPTQVEVSLDPTYRYPRARYGEMQIAVNPKNPNNLVYAAVEMAFTYACQAAKDPTCQIVQRTYGPGVSGQFNKKGFNELGVFVSFDRGKTWRRVKIPDYPPGKPEMHSKGDPTVTAVPDGTFYLGWDAIYWNEPMNPNPFAGIAVSKSTDGGLTWSQPVLPGTPIDGPKMTADLVTGMIYEASSGPLGPTATGDPKSPKGAFNDRWLVASKDGVKWTEPKRFGGTDGTKQFSGQGIMSAAHGTLGAAFRSMDAGACAFFVGGAAPCVVFQTTTDAGATWSRSRVPVAASSGGPMVAADPAKRGHFTVAVLNEGGTQYQVLQTNDSGKTWSMPALVAEDATKTHFKGWMAYSPSGVVGMMWRTNQPGSGPTFPYNIWAAVSRDGGATWSEPLEISTADSPAPQSGPFGNSGDDYSSIALDRQYAYIGWVDWRPGDRSAFFSAVKLEAFTNPGRNTRR